jgi:ABC-type multidrug transport system ATPase subunit
MIEISDLYLKKRIPEISRLNLRVADREVYVLLSSEDTAINHLINIFIGLEAGFKGTVKIDNTDIVAQRRECRDLFIYLDTGDQWPPDMKIGSVFSFFKKQLEIPEEKFEELYITLNMENINHLNIGELEEIQLRRILFALARLKASKNYIMHDIALGMPLDFKLELKKSILQLKSAGSALLYFSNDVFFAPEIGDRIGFMKKGKLMLELKAATMKKMNLRELYFQFLTEH